MFIESLVLAGENQGHTKRKTTWGTVGPTWPTVVNKRGKARVEVLEFWPVSTLLCENLVGGTCWRRSSIIHRSIYSSSIMTFIHGVLSINVNHFQISDFSFWLQLLSSSTTGFVLVCGYYESFFHVHSNFNGTVVPTQSHIICMFSMTKARSWTLEVFAKNSYHVRVLCFVNVIALDAGVTECKTAIL